MDDGGLHLGATGVKISNVILPPNADSGPRVSAIVAGRKCGVKLPKAE